MSVDGPVWHTIGRSIRDLVGDVLSWWSQSELQHHGAHRRSQLPPEGVRSTGGLCFGKRPSVHKLLATHTYHGRYMHIVGRSGRRWATLIVFTVLTSSSMWQLNVAVAHVQGRFRDTYPCSLPEIPGAPESSQRAALIGDTLIRTAGIVELSVSQRVDRGPEEGHGHGFYVIIVSIDSCLCDIISTEIRCKIDAKNECHHSGNMV